MPLQCCQSSKPKIHYRPLPIAKESLLLAILIICHHTYLPLYISAIMPFVHCTHQPLWPSANMPFIHGTHQSSCPSTIEPNEHHAYQTTWSSFTTFKPFGLFLYSLPSPSRISYSKYTIGGLGLVFLEKFIQDETVKIQKKQILWELVSFIVYFYKLYTSARNKKIFYCLLLLKNAFI